MEPVTGPTVFRFAGHSLDCGAGALRDGLGEVELRPKSLELLIFLVRNAGRAVSKDELLGAVWGGVIVTEDSLTQCVHDIRRALVDKDHKLIRTVARRGYLFPAEMLEGPVVQKASQRTGRPVIAVMPFDDLSGDPGRQYFSDGITQDIAARLSRYRILSVIGHDSSRAMRERGAGTAEIRETLAADYVVGGNVRASLERIRVAARLVDAKTETTLWAEHYDRPLSDVFAIQDDVSTLIASTLVGQVEVELGARRAEVAQADLTSYELVLQGIWRFKHLDTASVTAASDCFRRAIAAHPGNAEAHRWLSSCHLGIWLNELDRSQHRPSLALARKAIALDPASARCHTALGLMQLWANGIAAAAPSLRQAHALNPGDPDVLCEMGVLNAYAGDIAASHDFFERALTLNPFPPLWYGDMRAVAYFVEGRLEAALPGLEAVSFSAWDVMYMLGCYGLLGRRDEALELRTRIAREGKTWDFLSGAETEPFADPEPRQRLLTGLRIALGY